MVGAGQAEELLRGGASLASQRCANAFTAALSCAWLPESRSSAAAKCSNQADLDLPSPTRNAPLTCFNDLDRPLCD